MVIFCESNKEQAVDNIPYRNIIGARYWDKFNYCVFSEKTILINDYVNINVSLSKILSEGKEILHSVTNLRKWVYQMVGKDASIC